MKREKVKVEKRAVLGKKVKKLRREGVFPANIYGKDFASVSVQLPVKDFTHLFKKVGETGLIDLELGDKVIPALIHNVQYDVPTQQPIHADFYTVNLKEKIKANVPVVAVGEPQAVLDKRGVLLQLISELEIEALPTDLPEKIEVSVESLKEINEQITVEQVKSPSGVAILNEVGQIVFRIGELVSREAEEQAKAEEAAAAAVEEAKATAEEPKPAEGGEQAAPAQPQEEKPQPEPAK